MGLFGSRKQVGVASAVYNLAGDITQRNSYMKTVVVNQALHGQTNRTTMSQAIQNGLLAGPGFKLRSYAKWADRSGGYNDFMDITRTNLSAANTIDVDLLQDHISDMEGANCTLTFAKIEYGDYSYFAEKYMLENYPAEFSGDWVADFNDSDRNIYIQRPGGAGIVSFFAPNFSYSNRYIYAGYLLPNDNFKMFIYREGGGSAMLDNMFMAGENVGSFFAPILVRYENNFLSPSYMSTVYERGKKALKKATNGDLDDLIARIADNNDLGDIDHAFVIFGVSLNTPSNDARNYIFNFFDAMLQRYPGISPGGDLLAYQQAMIAAELRYEEWWNYVGQIEDRPKLLPPPIEPRSSISISCNRSDIDFDITLEWNYMESIAGPGLGRPGAKMGDVWITKGNSTIVTQTILGKNISYEVVPETKEEIRIYKQVAPDSYRYIKIQGLKHLNRVYKGKAVQTYAWEALDDTEESGFIIPLHDELFREMPIIKATEFATANTYLMFNCYKVVKKKWYQTGVFAIILIAIIVVISIWFPPAGAAAAGSGVLGTGAAVGGALGLSGTAAIVAGAIANAIAAMIIMNLITEVATSLFGEKVGAVVGAIAGIMTLQVGAAMANGASMATAFSGLMNPVNIMRLMTAAGKGYAEYLQKSSEEFAMKTQQTLEEYEGALEEISSKMKELVGTNGAVIDPLAFLDSTNGTFGAESRDSFLARTLMTGSDVAEMSIDLISEFTNITLDTSLV